MKKIILALFLVGALLGNCAALAQGDFPQTYDNYGREIVLTKRPEKVITAGPNCTELFIALGLADYVIGNSCDNHAQAPLDVYKDAYDKIPELTFGYPTLEAVVGSGADFLYAIDWVFEGDFTAEALEEYGVVTYANSAASVEAIFAEIRDIGRIFGVSEEAERFIADQQARIDAVTAAVEGKEPLKVFCYDSDTGSGVYTAGGPNIETELIALAGGVNVFANLEKAWIGVSLEEILHQQPDVIVVHDYDKPTAEEKIAAIKGDPILSQLDCVQKDRIVVLPLENAFPGSRTADCVEVVARGLYPELF
ncbi:MAG: ABC transporter substrate-binding protein [Clostridiales bacterium]|jgi:iron complex transport system substrate-binding protein|nr:ABC transporter substrate-binding protein [Clostridiales bacterium]